MRLVPRVLFTQRECSPSGDTHLGSDYEVDAPIGTGDTFWCLCA